MVVTITFVDLWRTEFYIAYRVLNICDRALI